VLTRLETRAAALESRPAPRSNCSRAIAFRHARMARDRPPAYRLVYRIERDTGTVLAVFDGRRDLEDVLLFAQDP